MGSTPTPGTRRKRPGSSNSRATGCQPGGCGCESRAGRCYRSVVFNGSMPRSNREGQGSNPCGSASDAARYANPAKRPGSNPGDCVGSTPTRVTEIMRRHGHRRAQAAVTRPHELCRFDSCPTHFTVRSAFGEAATLSTWIEGFDSPTDYCGQVAESADARASEARALGRGSATLPLVTRFSVHWCSGAARRPVEAEVRDRHPYASLLLRSGLEPGFQRGLISRPTSVQIRPPQLPGGRGPAAAHTRGIPGATPGPGMFGRVRKPAKRPGREPGDSAGSTPASATGRGRPPAAGGKDRRGRRADCRPPSSRRPGREARSRRPATTSVSHAGEGGSTPSGITARSASVSAARLRGKEEGRVQLPGGPLKGVNGDACSKGRRDCLASSLWWVRFPPSPLRKRIHHKDTKSTKEDKEFSILLRPLCPLCLCGESIDLEALANGRLNAPLKRRVRGFRPCGFDSHRFRCDRYGSEPAG